MQQQWKNQNLFHATFCEQRTLSRKQLPKLKFFRSSFLLSVVANMKSKKIPAYRDQRFRWVTIKKPTWVELATTMQLILLFSVGVARLKFCQQLLTLKIKGPMVLVLICEMPKNSNDFSLLIFQSVKSFSLLMFQSDNVQILYSVQFSLFLTFNKTSLLLKQLLSISSCEPVVDILRREGKQRFCC